MFPNGTEIEQTSLFHGQIVCTSIVSCLFFFRFIIDHIYLRTSSVLSKNGFCFSLQINEILCAMILVYETISHFDFSKRWKLSKKQKISDDKNELLKCALKERILQFHEIKMSCALYVYCRFNTSKDTQRLVGKCHASIYFGVFWCFASAIPFKSIKYSIDRIHIS